MFRDKKGEGVQQKSTLVLYEQFCKYNINKLFKLFAWNEGMKYLKSNQNLPKSTTNENLL